MPICYSPSPVDVSADLHSLILDAAIGLFGALTGGLTVYAKISSRLAVLEVRTKGLENLPARLAVLEKGQTTLDRRLEKHAEETRDKWDRLETWMQRIFESPSLNLRRVPREG